LGDRKDIGLVKNTIPLISGSVPEQVEEDDQGELAEPDSRGKMTTKQKQS